MSISRAFALLDIGPVDGEGDVATDDNTLNEIIESPDAAQAEVSETTGDIQSLEDLTDGAENTADTLDAIGEQVSKAEAEGGLSQPAAEALHLAVEALCATLPSTIRPRALASEAYGSKTARARATSLAKEDLADMARNAWAWIVSIWEKLKEFFKKWYKNFFDASTKCVNRWDKIIKLAKSKIDNGAKVPAAGKGDREVVLSEGVGKHVCDPIVSAIPANKADYGNWLKHTLSASTVDSITRNAVGVKGILSGTESLLEKVTDKKTYDDERNRIVKSLQDCVAGTPKTTAPEDCEAHILYRNYSTAIVFVLPKKVTDENVGKMEVRIGALANAKVLKTLKVVAMEPVSVLEIAQDQRATAKTLADRKRGIEEVESLNERIITAAKKTAAAATKEGDRNRSRSALKIVKISQRAVSAVTYHLHDQILSGSNAWATYMAQCLALATAKEDKEDNES